MSHGIGFADFEPVHFTNCAVDGRPITQGALTADEQPEHVVA